MVKNSTGWNPEQERAKFLKELSQALCLHPSGQEWLPKLLHPGNIGTAADCANVKKHFKKMHDVREVFEIMSKFHLYTPFHEMCVPRKLARISKHSSR